MLSFFLYFCLHCFGDVFINHHDTGQSGWSHHFTIHCTALHCTKLQYCTELHCTAQQCTALHSSALHCTVKKNYEVDESRFVHSFIQRFHQTSQRISWLILDLLQHETSSSGLWFMVFWRLGGKGSWTDRINEWITRLIVEQPRLHRVC